MTTKEKEQPKSKALPKKKVTMNWDPALVTDLEAMMEIENRNSLSNYTETLLKKVVAEWRQSGMPPR